MVTVADSSTLSRKNNHESSALTGLTEALAPMATIVDLCMKALRAVTGVPGVRPGVRGQSEKKRARAIRRDTEFIQRDKEM